MRQQMHAAIINKQALKPNHSRCIVNNPQSKNTHSQSAIDKQKQT